MVNWQLFLERGMDSATVYAPKLLSAIAVLFVGWILISWIRRFTNNRMKRFKVDRSLRPFFVSLLTWSLRALLLITVASMLGIQMTSFIALLGAAGLAVGLALQGSLSNFAGGVLILMLKPFKVGEYISAQGVEGDVTAIHIFNTEITTKDNKIISIPNGNLSNQMVTNFSRNPTRRVDMTFGIGYDDDFENAKRVILEIAAKDKRVLKRPAPFVKVAELADSSVNITTRFWVKTEEYWNVYFDTTESVKRIFDKKGVSIPYPQRDVHLYKHS